jgi:hypothetical protein
MIDQQTFQTNAILLKKKVQDHLLPIVNNLDSAFANVIKKHCVLSGGCFASLYRNGPVNDYDLWCTDIAGAIVIQDHLSRYNNLDVMGKEIEIKDVNPNYNDNFVDGKIVTSNATTLKNKLQFITKVNFEDARKSFDYLHCTIFYDLAQDKLYMSRAQCDSLHNKTLIPNNTSMIKECRREKFINRGWKDAV